MDVQSGITARGLKTYLYTFTAESLYCKRCGWKVIMSVPCKSHDTVVMEKDL